MQFLDERAPPASQKSTREAKAMGLSYYGFGRWGKAGKATHVVDASDNLVPLRHAHTVELPTKKKEVSNKRFMKKVSTAAEKKTVLSNAKFVKIKHPGLDSVIGGRNSTVATASDGIAFRLHPNAIGNEKEQKAPIKRNDIKQVYEDAAEAFSNMNEKEQEAIFRYTGGLYNQIREYLIDKKDATTHTAEKIASLDSALSKTKVSKDVIVYRGMDLKTTQKMLEAKEGNILENKHFMSTSLVPYMAQSFGMAIFVINVPKGSRGIALGNITQYEHENEFLLPRDTKLRISKVERRKNYWKDPDKLSGLIYNQRSTIRDMLAQKMHEKHPEKTYDDCWFKVTDSEVEEEFQKNYKAGLYDPLRIVCEVVNE